jgi:3-oxoacyl-[acyl-carrier protein] reductase
MTRPSGQRSIAGRVAVVTGAASGMGRATARLFAVEGAHVAIIDRDAGALHTLQDELAGENVAVHSEVVDLADAAAIAPAIEAARGSLGAIDIVVNNAGVSIPAEVDDPSYATVWEATMAVNLAAYVHTIRACLDDLRRDGTGRIVNVASTEGLGATAYLSPYTVSKHGVIGLTRALAVELGASGVTVNCVCPGPINTGMTSLIPDDAKAKYARRRVPLRRYGEPEEVAHATLSLVLPAMSYVNAAVLVVDGGMTAQNT